jgi:amino-acid N-acetyltransferase
MQSETLNNHLADPADLEDLPGVYRLLTECDLPSSDLISSQVRIWVLRKGQDIIGTIGLELYGDHGFLRSFAVTQPYRKLGMGGRLIDTLIEFSRSQGVHTLHLLTTSAENYFEKIGFKKWDRTEAPETIRGNAQFSTLCSSAAVYMNRKL